ncbi:DUF397 domain-containing protein [Streptomyces sp. ISL-1]|uniref:DUF397 domain-containing protein n=1 Tax=Streptomyces sp. ISL-1 TaxID=2817657 RepID=UPI002035E330|nr:DUF397 domain-containing protein [Streptomyces sp. ISL-1]
MTWFTWFKSSYSGTQGDNCVEVAASPGTVHVRDSMDPQGPQLSVDPGVWSSFVSYATDRQTRAGPATYERGRDVRPPRVSCRDHPGRQQVTSYGLGSALTR